MDKYPTNNRTPVLATSPTFPLLRQVDDDDFDFRQIFSVIRRRVWLILGVMSVGMGVVTINTLSQERLYRSQFRLLVEPVNTNNPFPNIASSLSQNLGGSQDKLDYNSQIQILRSPQLLKKALQPLQEQYPNLDYGSLSSNLSITQLVDTKILEISYQSTNPDQIEAVLQQLSSVYLEYSLLERQTNSRQGIKFIDQQLPNLQKQVDTLQLQLQKFRQDYSFTDPDTESNQLAQKAVTIETQQLQLQQEIAQAQTYIQSFQRESTAPAALKDAGVYEDIISQIQSVDAKIARESTRFQYDSLNIRVLEEERQKLLPILQQEAERVRATQLADAMTQLQILQARLPSLNQAQVEIRQSFENLPILNREYTELQQKLKIATDALTQFLESRQALEIETAQTEIPWQILEDPTRPDLPISPNIERSLILGLITSTIIGLGAAFLLDKFNDVYYSVDDLKNRTKLPLLGHIPYQEQYGIMEQGDKALPLMLRFKRWLGSLTLNTFVRTWRKKTGSHRTYDLYSYYGASAFSESLRLLRTNIKLLSADRPLRSVIIASALPGDGKSTIAMNLAQTAAILGQKTLLVDCDMRRPQIAQRLNLRQGDGLSTVLTNDSTETKVKEYFQRPMPLVDFSVLSSGDIPPDPAKLLSSQKMQHLVENFECTFDLVIYDTPPLLGLADASLLASHGDGVILVVTLNKTSRSAFSQAIATLKQAKIPILGVVANDQTRGNSDYSSYSFFGHDPTTNNNSAPTFNTPDSFFNEATSLTVYKTDEISN